MAVKSSKNINVESENRLNRMHDPPVLNRPASRAAGLHTLDLRRSRPERTSLRKWLLKTLQSLQCRTVIQDRFFDGIVGLVAELLFGARKVAGETGIGIGDGGL